MCYLLSIFYCRARSSLGAILTSPRLTLYVLPVVASSPSSRLLDPTTPRVAGRVSSLLPSAPMKLSSGISGAGTGEGRVGVGRPTHGSFRFLASRLFRPKARIVMRRIRCIPLSPALG